MLISDYEVKTASIISTHFDSILQLERSKLKSQFSFKIMPLLNISEYYGVKILPLKLSIVRHLFVLSICSNASQARLVILFLRFGDVFERDR